MGPRDRIASHLRRILVAAGMALPTQSPADTSTPNPQGKPGDAKKQPGNKKKDPEHLGYEVVDMMPEPFIDEAHKGTLSLKSQPAGAVILIDGKAIGKKTPLTNWKLAPGIHAITLKVGGAVHNFTVDIKADQNTAETRDLRPSPAPEPKK
jgi:hypothetical protein